MEGGLSEKAEEQFFLVEARPGEEGRDEIVLTISNFTVDEPQTHPAAGEAPVEKADETHSQKKTKGRPVHVGSETLPTAGLWVSFRGTSWPWMFSGVDFVAFGMSGNGRNFEPVSCFVNPIQECCVLHPDAFKS